MQCIASFKGMFDSRLSMIIAAILGGEDQHCESNADSISSAKRTSKYGAKKNSTCGAGTTCSHPTDVKFLGLKNYFFSGGKKNNLHLKVFETEKENGLEGEMKQALAKATFTKWYYLR